MNKRKITTSDAALIMGCSPQFVRIGMQRQILDIGDAVNISGTRWTYCISPSKLAERQGMTVEDLYREIERRRPA